MDLYFTLSTLLNNLLIEQTINTIYIHYFGLSYTVVCCLLFAASNIKPTMSDRLLYFMIQEIFSYCVFIDDISILLIECPLLGKKNKT